MTSAHRKKHPLQLGYSTNVHPGEDMKAVYRSLEEYTIPIRKRVFGSEPCGLELRRLPGGVRPGPLLGKRLSPQRFSCAKSQGDRLPAILGKPAAGELDIENRSHRRRDRSEGNQGLDQHSRRMFPGARPHTGRLQEACRQLPQHPGNLPRDRSGDRQNHGAGR